MTGKNLWRLCKTYGRLIGAPDLKPHDLRHGVAVEVLGQRHDLEEVRALLGDARIDTTQLLHPHPAAATQAGGGLLRGAGGQGLGRLGVKSQEVVHPSLVWEAGGCDAATHPSSEARMNIHQNAKTTPRSRAALVQRVQQGAESARDVAEAVGVSERTVRKWVGRYQAAGLAGLVDRSCRPHQSPDALPAALVGWIERLRRQRWTGAQIAQALQLSRATVARRLQGLGLARLRALEPAVPVRRYEWKQPGDLVHLDIKKLGRIGRIGHRITGDRRRRVRGIGWEYVHVAVDDATRLAYVEVLPDEQGVTRTESPVRGVPPLRRRH